MEYTAEEAAELAQLRADRRYAKEKLEEWIRKFKVIEAKLAEIEPPFDKGERVQPVSKGGLAYVDDCARAFGEWIVQVHFDSNPAKKYTYPARELRAV